MNANISNNLISQLMTFFCFVLLAGCSNSVDFGTGGNIDKTTIQMGGAIQGNNLKLLGKVSTLAGKAYQFSNPYGVVPCGSYLYVTDSERNTIRKVLIATGEVTTLAGSEGLAGADDGIGALARFSHPIGITTDGVSLYVADTGNCTIVAVHGTTKHTNRPKRRFV